MCKEIKNWFVIFFPTVKDILGELQLAFITFLVGQGRVHVFFYIKLGYIYRGRFDIIFLDKRKVIETK